MPRQVRIQYGGALYHVMARGDRREAIFFDDRDWKRWYWIALRLKMGARSTLSRATEPTGVGIAKSPGGEQEFLETKLANEGPLQETLS